ncbi:hypothetical protein [uncultured Salinicola sp.]|uniref:hypothetical protein n=1 Tax=uncultured Salinicola sp. TaxID=1193542 RepID=UPI00262A6389|nr:hypothetical protein [uncultured Salinicola sp.]|tara:strand:- start:548 stop:1030 length:483 start_codon:yes stop_codon:yes gene_type:complete
MKTTILRTGIILAGAISLAACGDSGDEPTNPYEQGGGQAEQADNGKTDAQAGKSVDMSEVSGRWTTESGAVGEGSRLVIDLTSEGVVSIDVRTMENGSEAIMESATGKATAQGSVVKGTVDKGPGVHGILGKYSTWTLNPSGTLTGGADSKPVKISKEGQ